jgi:hypothetical protein
VSSAASRWCPGDSVHYAIGRTTVLCNPFGYAGYELNAGFSDNLIVDV